MTLIPIHPTEYESAAEALDALDIDGTEIVRALDDDEQRQLVEEWNAYSGDDVDDVEDIRPILHDEWQGWVPHSCDVLLYEVLEARSETYVIEERGPDGYRIEEVW